MGLRKPGSRTFQADISLRAVARAPRFFADAPSPQHPRPTARVPMQCASTPTIIPRHQRHRRIHRVTRWTCCCTTNCSTAWSRASTGYGRGSGRLFRGSSRLPMCMMASVGRQDSHCCLQMLMNDTCRDRTGRISPASTTSCSGSMTTRNR